MKKNIIQIGQSCERLVIMQAVRQVKMMVSKENFMLVSHLKKMVNTLSLDNQCTSVCCKNIAWSLPISLQCAENTQEFRGLDLTKLTIFTVVSKMSFKLSGIPLAARASRWRLQWTQVVWGQLFAHSLPIHYVSLSWLLRHRYRYQHILTTKVHLMSQSSPVL